MQRLQTLIARYKALFGHAPPPSAVKAYAQGLNDLPAMLDRALASGQAVEEWATYKPLEGSLEEAILREGSTSPSQVAATSSSEPSPKKAAGQATRIGLGPLRPAPPDHPIYKQGFVIGQTRSSRSPSAPSPEKPQTPPEPEPPHRE